MIAKQKILSQEILKILACVCNDPDCLVHRQEVDPQPGRAEGFYLFYPVHLLILWLILSIIR